MKAYRAAALLAAVMLLIGATSCGRRIPGSIKNAWLAASRISVTTDDEPWKMAEGVYGLGSRFVVTDAVTQQRRQAVAYIASGVIPGLVKADQYGAYFAAKAGKKPGELHRNEFLADFLEADVEPLTSFVSDKKGSMPSMIEFTRRAMITLEPKAFSAKDDVILGPDGNELGWTLIVLAKAGQVTSSWLNVYERQVTMEEVLSVALSRPIEWGSYSGLIEQMGIARALRAYKIYKLNEDIAAYNAEKQKKKSGLGAPPTLETVVASGKWYDAEKHTKRVVKIMKKNQNDDGSFSKLWYRKKAAPANAEETILYTGQALDFLAVALDDKEIREPWVRKAAMATAKAINNNRYQLDGKNWAAMHAMHALRAYMDRLNDIGKMPKELRNQEEPPKECCG